MEDSAVENSGEWRRISLGSDRVIIEQFFTGGDAALELFRGGFAGGDPGLGEGSEWSPEEEGCEHSDDLSNFFISDPRQSPDRHKHRESYRKIGPAAWMYARHP